MKPRRPRSVQLTQDGIAKVRQKMCEMVGSPLPPINLANLAGVTLKELEAYQKDDYVYPAVANQIKTAQAKLLKPWTYQVLAAAASVSETTIKRILGARKDKNPQRSSVISVAHALNLDPADLVLPGSWNEAAASDEKNNSPEHPPEPLQDWGEAPDVPIFFGRDEDLALLEQWIVDERARLVAIVGIGGIGKTGLSIKLGRGGIGKTDLSLELARDISGDFDYIIWRSLIGAPPPEQLLFEITKFLSGDLDFAYADQLGEQISQLIECMQRNRCLIILDNLETILNSGECPGKGVLLTSDYLEGYEGYGLFLHKASEVPHQSCVLLTSREKPKNLERLSRHDKPVYFHYLHGLDSESSQAIFSQLGSFCATEAQWQQLVDIYNGNPLILEIAANHIRDVFFGDVASFLTEGEQCFDDIYSLLDSFCQRLSESELDVAYWLALNRGPTSYKELKSDILSVPAKGKLSSTLQSLQRRLPLERNSGGFSLQPVLIEYLTTRLMEQVSIEIEENSLTLLNSYALLKASGKDYIREIQKNLILKPLLQLLLDKCGSTHKLVAQLKQVLLTLKAQPSIIPGYAAGNLINLLSQLTISLAGWDFSQLALWQADLRATKLHQVNFAHCHLQNTIFAETNHEVFAVACSADGRLIATGDGNSNVHLWNSTTNKQVAILKGHTYWVWSVAFSPDTRLLASGSFDCTIRIWDIMTAKCLKILKGHTKWVWSVVFSPDGKTLISGGHDGVVYIWDVSTGNCLGSLLETDAPIYSIAISADGKTLAIGGEEQSVWLWNLDTSQIIKKLDLQDGAIWSVALSSNNRYLATGSDNGTVRLWDTASGCCSNVLQVHTAPVWSVAFSVDGQTLASGSHDRTIQLWDTSTGQRLNTLHGHENWIWSITFSSDNQTLVSGSEDQSLKIWNIKTGQCLQTFQGYVNWIRCIEYLPDSSILVSSSEEGTVDLWDASSGKHLDTLYQGLSSVQTITAAAVKWLASDTESICLAIGIEDGKIQFWNPSDYQPLFSIQGHSTKISTLRFSPDGITLVCGDSDGALQLWHMPTREKSKWDAHGGWICALAFNSNGQKLVSGGSDGLVKVWDVSSGKCLQVLEGHTIWAYTVAFSPNDQLIASGGNDQTLRIWEVKTGQCLMCVDELDTVRVISFSPDGQILAIGTDNRSVLIWNIEQQQFVGVFEGHTNAITDLAFSSDGLTLATSSQDETLKIWELQTGECIHTMQLPRLYEGADMREIVGLNDAQRIALSTFGAVL